VKKHLDDDHKHFVETLLQFDVGRLLFVKVKKHFVDDHKLFV
jgi:hypothetical protein